MTINNFKIIEDKFLTFEQGYYYKFECIVRNTDGENPLYVPDMSNSKKNISIKSWYFSSQEQYDRHKFEMIQLCNLLDARLYICLDRKSNKNTMRTIFTKISNLIFDQVYESTTSTKSLTNIVTSCTSLAESSDSSRKTWMFDIDEKNIELVNKITTFFRNKNLPYWILDTKKGYHIVSYKKFSIEEVINHLEKLDVTKEWVAQNLSIVANRLGLVYMK